MRIGAYQFPVTGNITENMSHILDAVSRASREGVELLVFPECAVTGYPPLALPSPAEIDEERKNEAHTQLQKTAIQNRMHLIAGTIIRRGSSFYNAALCFAPDGTVTEYDKRALWGWDQENFTPGTRDGILQAGTLKIGIRICFEVRFPEYFRELYRAKTDLNVILKAACITRVLCNGQTAGRLYQRLQQPLTGLPAQILPSTSPLNAAWSLERLAEAWGKALKTEGRVEVGEWSFGFDCHYQISTK